MQPSTIQDPLLLVNVKTQLHISQGLLPELLIRLVLLNLLFVLQNLALCFLHLPLLGNVELLISYRLFEQFLHLLSMHSVHAGLSHAEGKCPHAVEACISLLAILSLCRWWSLLNYLLVVLEAVCSVVHCILVPCLLLFGRLYWRRRHFLPSSLPPPSHGFLLLWDYCELGWFLNRCRCFLFPSSSYSGASGTHEACFLGPKPYLSTAAAFLRPMLIINLEYSDHQVSHGQNSGLLANEALNRPVSSRCYEHVFSWYL